MNYTNFKEEIDHDVADAMATLWNEIDSQEELMLGQLSKSL